MAMSTSGEQCNEQSLLAIDPEAENSFFIAIGLFGSGANLFLFLLVLSFKRLRRQKAYAILCSYASAEFIYCIAYVSIGIYRLSDPEVPELIKAYTCLKIFHAAPTIIGPQLCALTFCAVCIDTFISTTLHKYYWRWNKRYISAIVGVPFVAICLSYVYAWIRTAETKSSVFVKGACVLYEILPVQYYSFHIILQLCCNGIGLLAIFYAQTIAWCQRQLNPPDLWPPKPVKKYADTVAIMSLTQTVLFLIPFIMINGGLTLFDLDCVGAAMVIRSMKMVILLHCLVNPLVFLTGAPDLRQKALFALKFSCFRRANHKQVSVIELIDNSGHVNGNSYAPNGTPRVT